MVSKTEIRRAAREALRLWLSAKDLYVVIKMRGKKLWVGYSTTPSAYDIAGETIKWLAPWDRDILPDDKRYWLQTTIEIIERALREYEGEEETWQDVLREMLREKGAL